MKVTLKPFLTRKQAGQAVQRQEVSLEVSLLDLVGQ